MQPHVLPYGVLWKLVVTYVGLFWHIYRSHLTHFWWRSGSSDGDGAARVVVWRRERCYFRHSQTHSYTTTGMCVAVCCNVLQCVAMCCSVLQCVAVRCSVWRERCYFRHFQTHSHTIAGAYMCCSMLQSVAVCCSVLQCVAVRCSVWWDHWHALKKSPTHTQNRILTQLSHLRATQLCISDNELYIAAKKLHAQPHESASHTCLLKNSILPLKSCMCNCTGPYLMWRAVN